MECISPSVVHFLANLYRHTFYLMHEITHKTIQHSQSDRY